jgi:hypothetical protein
MTVTDGMIHLIIKTVNGNDQVKRRKNSVLGGRFCLIG